MRKNIFSRRYSDTILSCSLNLSITVYNLGYNAITLMTMFHKYRFV